MVGRTQRAQILGSRATGFFRSDESAREPQPELSDWLEVSWFYPEGFKKQERIETPTATLIVGESLVYAFLKALAPEESAAERFRRACNEIADHQRLAPDLYLGVRLLRWVDGEPRWLSEIPSVSPLPADLPFQADEVTLVLRRVPSSALLSGLIAADDEISNETLGKLNARLLRFFRRQMRTNSGRFGAAELGLKSIRIRLESVQEFVAAYGSGLDPISSSSLQHCTAYLSTFLELHAHDLSRRQQRGFLIDGHGNLAAHTIAICSLVPGGRSVSLLDRANRVDRRRDVLSDVADLVTDLEIRAAETLARGVEQHVLRELRGAFDENWYRFYCVLAALVRVTELFEREAATDHEALRRALAAAVRRSFGLARSFGIVIADKPRGAGDEQYEMHYLAECLAELGGMSFLNRFAYPPELPGYRPLEDTVFQRLLVHLVAELDEARPVLLRWPCTDEQLFTLRRIFSARELPWLVIRLDDASKRPAKLPANPAPVAVVQTDRAAEGRAETNRSAGIKAALPELPLLPQPELGLYVLSELAKKNREIASPAAAFA